MLLLVFMTLFPGSGGGVLAWAVDTLNPQPGCPIPNQEKSRGGICGEEVFNPHFQRWSGESDHEEKQKT